MPCTEIQQKLPAVIQTSFPDRIQWVQPSLDKSFQQGQLLEIDPFPRYNEWALQKMSDRDYFMYANAYALTVHLGEKGVLVIDPHRFMDVETFYENLRRITPLPVTAIVYSHGHIDHIERAKDIIRKEKEENGHDVRIIGSDRCAKELDRYGRQAPMPTDVVDSSRPGFEFEGREFVMKTPVEWAHCGSDSYIITPDRVGHAVDFVQPERLPLFDVSNCENLDGYIMFLRHFAGEDFTLLNPAHCNIGSKQDVLMTLEYFKDIYELCYGFMYENWSPAMIDAVPDEMRGSLAVGLQNVVDMQIAVYASMLEPKWGKVPHFEVAGSHIIHVVSDIGMYYDLEAGPQVLPTFEPIPA